MTENQLMIGLTHKSQVHQRVQHIERPSCQVVGRTFFILTTVCLEYCLDSVLVKGFTTDLEVSALPEVNTHKKL